MTLNPETPSFESLLLPEKFNDGGEGWADAKPFPDAGTKHSFVSGNRESRAIRVRYFQRAQVKQFAGRAWFGPETEGPPGHAHGGSQAALLDEGMGAAAWLSGFPVLAAKIEINFRSPLPIGTVLTLWSSITRVEGRKVYTTGRLEADDGKIISEGVGLFIIFDPKILGAS